MTRTMRIFGLGIAAALFVAGGVAGADQKNHGDPSPPPAVDAHPAGRSASHAGAKAQATKGGTRSGAVGPGSSETLRNGSNADVGNSTGTSATERMPHAGTPSR